MAQDKTTAPRNCKDTFIVLKKASLRFPVRSPLRPPSAAAPFPRAQKKKK